MENNSKSIIIKFNIHIQLLSEDETQRPDVNQLLANLPPYDQFKQLEAQNMYFGNARPQVRNEIALEQKPIDNLNLFNASLRQNHIVHNSFPFEIQVPLVQQNDSNTITYIRPITHNVYSQPIPEYSYSQPPVYYSYNDPNVQTNQYTYTQPAIQTIYQPSTQYISRPVEYSDYNYIIEKKVDAIPNATYISTQDNISNVSNLQFKHSYEDNAINIQPMKELSDTLLKLFQMKSTHSVHHQL